MRAFLQKHKTIALFLGIVCIVGLCWGGNYFFAWLDYRDEMNCLRSDNFAVADIKSYQDDYKSYEAKLSVEESEQLIALLTSLEFDGIYMNAQLPIMQEDNCYAIYLVNEERIVLFLVAEKDELNYVSGANKKIALKKSSELILYLDSLFEKSGEV